MEKTCKRCGESKPATADYFGVSKGSFRSMCRPCKYAHERDYMKGYLAGYFQANKPVLTERNAKWQAEHPDEMKAYRRAYEIRNKDVTGLRCSQWRKENPDRARVIQKRYESSNPEVRRTCQSNRRAREGGLRGRATVPHVRRLMLAQKGRCWWCQCKLDSKHHLDHRIPLAKGGTSEANNLVLACPPCNLKKSTKMPWQIDNPRLL